MKTIEQTKLHNPPDQNGNCLNAALASLLELDIEAMPHFEDMEDDKWYSAVVDWLFELGFWLVTWDGERYLPGYYIAHGQSPRGFEHSVVYKGRDMVHDPHPSKAGLEKITSVWVLVPVNPAQALR